MSKTITRTSVSLEKSLVPRARAKAAKNGQSFSSYISVLIRSDIDATGTVNRVSAKAESK